MSISRPEFLDPGIYLLGSGDDNFSVRGQLYDKLVAPETGEFYISLAIRMEALVPETEQVILDIANSSNSNIRYDVRVNSDGKFQFTYTDDVFSVRTIVNSEKAVTGVIYSITIGVTETDQLLRVDSVQSDDEFSAVNILTTGWDIINLGGKLTDLTEDAQPAMVQAADVSVFDIYFYEDPLDIGTAETVIGKKYQDFDTIRTFPSPYQIFRKLAGIKAAIESNFITEFKDKENLTKVMCIASEELERIKTDIMDLQVGIWIEEATGATLDLVGINIIGLARKNDINSGELSTDNQYRFDLKTQILKNTNQGNLDRILIIAQRDTETNGSTCQIQNTKNASLSLYMNDVDKAVFFGGLAEMERLVSAGSSATLKVLKGEKKADGTLEPYFSLDDESFDSVLGAGFGSLEDPLLGGQLVGLLGNKSSQNIPLTDVFFGMELVEQALKPAPSSQIIELSLTENTDYLVDAFGKLTQVTDKVGDTLTLDTIAIEEPFLSYLNIPFTGDNYMFMDSLPDIPTMCVTFRCFIASEDAKDFGAMVSFSTAGDAYDDTAWELLQDPSGGWRLRMRSDGVDVELVSINNIVYDEVSTVSLLIEPGRQRLFVNDFKEIDSANDMDTSGHVGNRSRLKFGSDSANSPTTRSKFNMFDFNIYSDPDERSVAEEYTLEQSTGQPTIITANKSGGFGATGFESSSINGQLVGNLISND